MVILVQHVACWYNG